MSGDNPLGLWCNGNPSNWWDWLDETGAAALLISEHESPETFAEARRHVPMLFYRPYSDWKLENGSAPFVAELRTKAKLLGQNLIIEGYPNEPTIETVGHAIAYDQLYIDLCDAFPSEVFCWGALGTGSARSELVPYMLRSLRRAKIISLHGYWKPDSGFWEIYQTIYDFVAALPLDVREALARGDKILVMGEFGVREVSGSRGNGWQGNMSEAEAVALTRECVRHMLALVTIALNFGVGLGGTWQSYGLDPIMPELKTVYRESIARAPDPPMPSAPVTGPPTIEYFKAEPAAIVAGETAVLEWGAVTNAERAEIDQGIGGVATPGWRAVAPAQTTTYTLTATRGTLMTTSATTVTVRMPSITDTVLEAARKLTWMPINVEAALYEFAQAHALGYPQTDEFEFEFGGDAYVGQVFNLGIAYVKKGDWGNCQWIKKESV